MRRRVKLVSLVLSVIFAAILIVFSGCGRQQEETGVQDGDKDFPVTITDGLGRQVTIEEEPERIVSMAPKNTEILFSLELGEKVVGVTEYCDYPPEAKEKTQIGGFSNPSMELVVAQEPDLVLATDRHEKFISQLESSGIATVVLEANTLDGVIENINTTGKISGANKKAKELTIELKERINDIKSKVEDAEKPLVYFEIWPDPLTTGGAESILHNLIVTAGGKNIAGDIEKDWVTLNSEVVLSENPDVIITSYHEASGKTIKEVESRQGWGDITAVENNRIYSVEDKDLVQLGGPRIVKGLEEVAEYIHPELFNEQ